MPAEKICIICGTDCADRPRLKDSQGRYACQTCIEAKRRHDKKAAKPETPTATAAATAAAAPADAPAAGGGAGFSMDQFLEGVHAADANPCPKCGMGRPPGAIVCMQCGFDSASGKSMTTKVGKDKPKKERNAPRLSSGAICMLIALAMLVVLPVLALTSPEGLGVALVITVLWNLVAYAYMVGSAFRDDDKFWGILGVMFWVPLVGGICWLAFVLYYCTIGSQRGVRKVNYWASWFAVMIVFAIWVSNNPDVFSGSSP